MAHRRSDSIRRLQNLNNNKYADSTSRETLLDDIEEPDERSAHDADVEVPLSYRTKKQGSGRSPFGVAQLVLLVVVCAAVLAIAGGLAAPSRSKQNSNDDEAAKKAASEKAAADKAVAEHADVEKLAADKPAHVVITTPSSAAAAAATPSTFSTSSSTAPAATTSRTSISTTTTTSSKAAKDKAAKEAALAAGVDMATVAPGTIIDGHCLKPNLRKEWRTLTEDEKLNYIEAVNCLATKPSKLRENGTLYDDFPWVHSWVGMDAHSSAGFSSWHRYFLHLYERYLRDDCGYRGHLTYWDWSLDWLDLRVSPIWDNKLGMGGDGEKKGVEGVSHGYCIDGPFKDLRPSFHVGETIPHCLSRGFFTDYEQVRQAGTMVSPEAVESMLELPDYAQFVLKLEKTTHDAIHNVVRGDFMEATAPNDPLFYLHHVQLDRMWWMWQQRDLDTRLTEYTGNSSKNSNTPASLSDPIDVHGLAPNAQVKDIIDAEGGFLCYRY